jgi:hypothetical protein
MQATQAQTKTPDNSDQELVILAQRTDLERNWEALRLLG